MTDEALDQYPSRVLLDALRMEWDDTGQDDAFTPSRKYQNEMRELAANPAAWYKKKTEPPWPRYVRQFSTLAAIVAVCIVAVWLLPDGGEAAAQAPAGSLPVALLALAAIGAIALLVDKKRRK